MTSAGRRLVPSLGLVLLVIVITPRGAPAGPRKTAGDETASRARRPVALALASGGDTLLVANGRSGTISVIDLRSGTRVAETKVARALSDLASLPDSIRFAAIDPEAGELLLLEHRSDRLAVKSRLAVGLDPICVA